VESIPVLKLKSYKFVLGIQLCDVIFLLTLQMARSVISFLLSHIGLLSLVVGYCIMGAAIFEVSCSSDGDQ
jgi:hypothetical protein